MKLNVKEQREKLKSYVSGLSSFKKEATIALINGESAEKIAMRHAERNGTKIGTSRAHVGRAVAGLERLRAQFIAKYGKAAKFLPIKLEATPAKRVRTSATPAQTTKAVRKVKIKSYSDLVALAKANGQTIVITLRPTRKRNSRK